MLIHMKLSISRYETFLIILWYLKRWIQVGSEDDESPYILNMDVMEDEFYDGILGFLEERGITDEFIENLCHVGTGLKYQWICDSGFPDRNDSHVELFVDQL